MNNSGIIDVKDFHMFSDKDVQSSDVNYQYGPGVKSAV